MTKNRMHVVKPLFGSLVASLIVGVPATVVAAPNANSVADFEACLEDDATVRVCSSKELSNVVVQCDAADGTTSFFKYDDLDDPESPSAGNLETAYEGVFPCPDGGTIAAVFVKSGSEKYAGDPIEGLPRGSGALWTPQDCPVECPTPSLEDEDETEEGEEEVAQ